MKRKEKKFDPCDLDFKKTAFDRFNQITVYKQNPRPCLLLAPTGFYRDHSVLTTITNHH